MKSFKLKKSLLAVLLVFSMVLPSVSILAAGPVKMYAVDGRTVQVDSNDVEVWKSVGWHEGTESIGVYAADGRTMYVFYKDLAAYKNVGWYILPPVTMYAADGRTLLIDGAEVEAYKNVGWYVLPPVTMYAADGRTMLIDGAEVEAYKNVGWFVSPPVTMYAPDGRTLLVAGTDVAAWKNVGWYTEPVSGNKTEVETFVNNFFETLKSGNLTSLLYFYAPGSDAYDEFVSAIGDMTQLMDGMEELGLSQNDISEITADMYKSLFGEINYEIFNVKVTGNTASVQYKMSSPDYSSVDSNDVDMDSIMIKAFSDAGYPMWNLAAMSEYEIKRIMPKVMKSVMKSYTAAMINTAKRNGTTIEEGTIKLKNIGGQWFVETN